MSRWCGGAHSACVCHIFIYFWSLLLLTLCQFNDSGYYRGPDRDPDSNKNCHSDHGSPTIYFDFDDSNPFPVAKFHIFCIPLISTTSLHILFLECCPKPSRGIQQFGSTHITDQQHKPPVCRSNNPRIKVW